MKMVEFIVLEILVLWDRFLNCFPVKMANWVFDPRRRLNYMMDLGYDHQSIQFDGSTELEIFN